MNLAEALAQADAATQDIELKPMEHDLVEPGTYDVAVTGCEGPKESSRTNPKNPEEHGQYLKIECTITGPKAVGRKLWMNNNIICFPKSLSDDDVRRCQTAMAMGAKERKVMLDSLCRTGINEASELVGASFQAVVAIERGMNGYKDKSVIKAVRPLGGVAKAATTSAPAPKAAPAPSAKPKMPWEK